MFNGGGSWGCWLGDCHESGPYGSRLICVSSMVFIGHNGFWIGLDLVSLSKLG